MADMQLETSYPVKLLQMVQQLHRRGHELIRITPYLSPSGLHWRCDVDGKPWTSAAEAEFYGVPRAGDRTPEELADLYAERFPDVVALGTGKDPEYARWLDEVVELAERGFLPVFFADHELPAQDGVHLIALAGAEGEATLRKPPPRSEARWSRAIR